MEIFDLEYSIKDKLLNNKAVAYCSLQLDKIVRADTNDNKNTLIGLLKKNNLTSDVLWFPAILVTTNWNGNDDVFFTSEVWSARKTPVGKPVNWQHVIGEKNNEIIGVINSCIPIKDDYSIVTDNIENINDIDKFHLSIGCMIWQKYFPSYAEEIIARIPENNLFVSMECEFYGFNYAFREFNSDTIILVERTSKNSWLTQFLRAYGGRGVVKLKDKEYKIGRVLKNITFTGVGCVNTPGNNESVILIDDVNTVNYHMASASLNDDLNKICENCVLFIDDKNTSNIMSKENNDKVTEETKACSCATSSEKDTMAARMKELEDECASLKDTMAKMKSDSEAQLSTLAESLKSAQSELDAANKSKAEVVASLDTANAKLLEIHKDKVGNARIAEMSSFNAVANKEQDFVKLSNMSDESYALVRDFAKASFNASKASVENKTESTKASDNTVDAATKELESTVTDDKDASLASAKSPNEIDNFINFFRNVSK